MDDERRYLIGADLGTTAVKVGLFDTDGRAVAVDTVEHTLITPATGVVEQSPDVYWGAFKACLQRVLDTAGINRAAIIAMSLSVQGETLTFLDADCQYRAIIYEDGPEADYQTNPYPMSIRQLEVNNHTTLHLKLAPSGGAAIRIEKE